MVKGWKGAVGRLRCLGFGVWLAALLAVPVGSQAQDAAAPESLEEAVAQIERTQPGRILSARGERRGANVVYHIRVLTPDREVRNFELAGAAGAQP